MLSDKPRVDYDRIAPLYDEPSRDFEADARLQTYLEERGPRNTAGLRILDMGCGTGKQLAADQRAFPDLSPIGLDRYRGMLRFARERSPTIPWANGDNTWAPFANQSFSYITNQFSYHHVPNKARLIGETFRLLQPGGRFVITNLDPWSMPGWWIYTFFPAARARDSQDFLPVDELTALLTKAGFIEVHATREHQPEVQSAGRMLDYARRRYRTSQLISIPDRDYEDGLGRLQERAQQAGRGATVPSEICLVFITADRPRPTDAT